MNQTKDAISPARKRLVQIMQELNFGRIESLMIRSGEPVWDPAPRIIRQIKLCGDNGPRLDQGIKDFKLKNQVGELFDHFNSLGTCCIESLEVQHGLPFRLVVEQPA